jgi:crotonobetainyl-CoA:carnitine CoA-transferase CaiB-like acyl-CoA transferase
LKGPLTGIKVVELGSAIASPLCSALLGDMGADVVKIEPPGRGDDSRRWGEKVRGESPYFLQYNRNKRSAALDIRKAEGRKAVLRLIARSDVLIENFRPGTMKKLSLAYSSVHRVNPRLVYCSVSGFGQTGPYRQRGGYDAIIQAISGLMSITGEGDGPPMRVGVPITDIIAALYAAYAVALALLRREGTGVGEQIDVSLFESGVSAIAQWISIYSLTGKPTKRFGNRYPLLAPYELFDTKDRPIVVAVGNDDLWGRLCRLIGRDELVNDHRFKTNNDRIVPENRAVLTEILEGIFKTESAGAWEGKLRKSGIPVGIINSIEDLAKDPQLIARKSFAPMIHSALGKVSLFLGLPRFSGVAVRIRRASPRLGEHTEEILRELGYSKKQIAKMRQENII